MTMSELLQRHEPTNRAIAILIYTTTGWPGRGRFGSTSVPKARPWHSCTKRSRVE